MRTDSSSFSFLGLSPGIAHIVVGSFCFSCMTVLVKLSGEFFPSQQIVFARSFVVMIASIALIKWMKLPPRGQNVKLLMIRSITGFSALSCFFFALTRLPLAEVTLLGFTRPIYLVIMAAVFLGEPIKGKEVLGILASIVGVVLITKPPFLFGLTENSLDPLGSAFALAGAFLSAVAHLAIRGLKDSDHPYVIILYFAGVAMVGSVPLLAMASGVTFPTWWGWALLLGVGVFAMLGQINLTKGLHLERAGKVAVVSYLGIIYSFLWGMVIFAEFPTPLGLVGAAFIIGSVVTVAKPKKAPEGP